MKGRNLSHQKGLRNFKKTQPVSKNETDIKKDDGIRY
jgi:hypothetical protein